jgi:hypothetical protein
MIRRDYGKDFKDVFIGLVVYRKFGVKAYYSSNDELLKTSEKYEANKEMWIRASMKGTIPDSENPIFIFNQVSDKLLKDLLQNKLDVRQLLFLEAEARRMEF